MTSTGRRRGVPITLSILGILAFAGVMLFALASMVSHQKIDRAVAEWERELGTLDDILADRPARGANASALAVEEISARLGVDLSPRWVDEGRARPDGPGAYRDARKALADYVDTVLATDTDTVAPAPETAASFLDGAAADLEALRVQLVGETPPLWERELEKMWSAPIPNLMGHINLQRMLAADALHHLANGREDTALRDLEASWRLNLALRDDPIVITQLISLGATRLQTGVLRRVRRAPPVWAERIAEHDPRRDLMGALKFETWLMSRLDDPTVFAQQGGILPRLLANVGQPYTRYCAADLSEKMRRRLERLESLEWLCDRNLAELGADLGVSLPRWNFLSIAVPDFSDTIERMARLEIDLELTGLVLASRAGEDPRGELASTSCPEDRWLVERDGDALRIALSREPEWPAGVRGVRLPTAARLGDQPRSR